ncbi:uncharacterized protein LOC115896335 isoform X2 [Rhinopithecus roxellana]|uniref:uncharacterized protein LOC115896335 isoform X2 n=1 Tax=Rhinopithecus roxellana TaxID=61622 RepID=UPI0012376F8A|nr:uncharacterized protein LOC115896335 isoform X2 [Rhinopithecus roxellana]
MLQEYLPMFTKKHVQGFHCSNAELSASQFAQFIKKQCGATGTNHEASPGSLTSYPSHLLDRRCQLITLNVSSETQKIHNSRHEGSEGQPAYLEEGNLPSLQRIRDPMHFTWIIQTQKLKYVSEITVKPL